MKRPARIARLSWLHIWVAVAVVLAFIVGIIRSGPTQTVIVVALISVLLVGTFLTWPPDMNGAPAAAWLALTLIGLSPVAFDLPIFVITPTYFRPLFETGPGATMLIAFGAAVVVANAPAQLAVRYFRRSHTAGRVALTMLTAIYVVRHF